MHVGAITISVFFSANVTYIISDTLHFFSQNWMSDLFLYHAVLFSLCSVPSTSDNHMVFNNVLEMFCFAGVLRILTEMFLPHISLGDLEETFFSKVLPKVCHLQLNVTFSVSTVLKTCLQCIGSSFEGSAENHYFACKA